MVRYPSLSPHHAPLLAALHGDGFAAPWDADAFGALLAHPGAFGLLAVTGNGEAETPVGFILLRRAADEAEIITLVVLSSHRLRGIGRALLDGACAEAGRIGVFNVFLEVGAENAAARALYEGAGFVAGGVRRGYYGRGHDGAGRAEDALILTRRLNGTGA